MPLQAPTPLPSAEYLDACFRLDPETGALFWKQRPADHFSPTYYVNRWAFRVGKRADIPAKDGYRRVRLTVNGAGKMYGAHRVIWKMVHRSEPGPELDHINRNPGDNRPENLREATRSQNNSNQFRRGPVGVFPRDGKFRAQISVENKSLSLGTYLTHQEATAAVAEALAKREAAG